MFGIWIAIASPWTVAFFSLFIDCHWLLRCLNCTQLFLAQREWRKKAEALHCMAEHKKRVTIRSDYCYGSILQLSFAFQWMKRERERKTRTNDFYSFSLDCQQKRCLWRVLCETHWCRLNAVFLLSAHKHMWFDRKETDEWNKFNKTMPQSIHSSIH